MRAQISNIKVSEKAQEEIDQTIGAVERALKEAFKINNIDEEVTNDLVYILIKEMYNNGLCMVLRQTIDELTSKVENSSK